MDHVVEGVLTSNAVLKLASISDVEMPITTTVHSILFEGMSPQDAIIQLMSRSLKTEQVG